MGSRGQADLESAFGTDRLLWHWIRQTDAVGGGHLRHGAHQGATGGGVQNGAREEALTQGAAEYLAIRIGQRIARKIVRRRRDVENEYAGRHGGQIEAQRRVTR